jgi:CMP-N-acetylneuraminic acid synthetase
MYYIENGGLIPYFSWDRDLRFKEPFNQARQNFPDTYLHNGCIDIVKTSVVLGGIGVISGSRIMPYIMRDDEVDDIDTLNDFINSENKSIINI